jgi:hypothetical protein
LLSHGYLQLFFGCSSVPGNHARQTAPVSRGGFALVEGWFEHQLFLHCHADFAVAAIVVTHRGLQRQARNQTGVLYNCGCNMTGLAVLDLMLVIYGNRNAIGAVFYNDLELAHSDYSLDLNVGWQSY